MRAASTPDTTTQKSEKSIWKIQKMEEQTFMNFLQVPDVMKYK